MQVRRKPIGDGNLLDDASNATRSNASPALVDKQGRRALASFPKKFLSFRKINGKRAPRRIAEGHVPLLLPFAANENQFRTQTNVVKVDSSEFRVANAASIKQFQHQKVALGKCGNLR